ncbi:endonuclease domain-containing 1 protein-like [Xyrauchen texanus]|uniref:endonuclease domain-containing 1 protein-like n=1 Tax=Xyrauchen texanus TaxID=154827 RepID=UPI002241D0FC|nr:endonuclease domain-containing 1 protein-like [Xyrauchen texanus]
MHLLIVSWFVLHFSFLGDAAVVNQPVFAENTECAKYFFSKTEPVGLNPTSLARICQTYRNDVTGHESVYFATLYDRINRIPIYSAYILKISNGDNEKYWQIEPQLVDNNFEAAMARESDFKLKHANINDEDIKLHQAVESDYEKYSNTYDKGHLNPNGHHDMPESRSATYTLTNIVPQTKLVNQQIWTIYEKKLQTLQNNKKCKDLYVVTGAVPSANRWLMDGTETRVNVPSHIWSAYCCVDNNEEPLENGGRLIKNEEFEVTYDISKATSAKDRSTIIKNIINNELKSMSVPELQVQLKTLLNAKEEIMIFHGKCSHKTP